MAKKKKNKTSRKMNIQELPTDARDSIFKQMDAFSTGRFALTNRKNRDDTRDSKESKKIRREALTGVIAKLNTTGQQIRDRAYTLGDHPTMEDAEMRPRGGYNWPKNIGFGWKAVDDKVIMRIPHSKHLSFRMGEIPHKPDEDLGARARIHRMGILRLKDRRLDGYIEEMKDTLENSPNFVE
jgi:hypothetical protein